MGLFSSEKVVSVASTAYNMAGPLAERPDYLKTTVARSVLTGDPDASLGSQITGSQLNGPTFDQRRFFRWSNLHYPLGKLTGSYSRKKAVSAASVQPFITVPSGSRAIVQRSMIDGADVNYWAERYILETRPEDFDTAWELDSETGSSEVTISYVDGTSEIVDFVAFNPFKEYLVAYYVLTDETDISTSSMGTLVEEDPAKPDTTGWKLNTSQEYSTNVRLTHTTTTTVDGGTPVVEETTEIVSYTGLDEEFEQSYYQPIDPDIPVQYKDVDTISIMSVPVIVSTTTSTTTTENGQTTVVEETVESIEDAWDHQTEYRYDVTVFDYRGGNGIFIYEMGSGNATLDALNETDPVSQEFFPAIPLRIDNKPISHPDFAESFPMYEEAFERGVGGEIQDILEEIEKNESVGDIDFAYVVHGVELNTQEPHGKRYLYEFIRGLMDAQQSSLNELNAWKARADTYQQYLDDIEAWENAQLLGGPLKGTERPEYVELEAPESSAVDIQSTVLGYRTRLHWLAIGEVTGTGEGKPGARVGDIWWEQDFPDVILPPIQNFRNSFFGFLSNDRTLENVRLYWQDGVNSHKYLDIFGLGHENFVYQNRAVKISTKEALNNPDESGFIIPLHNPSLKLIGVVNANQLVASSKLVVFNSYKITTVRWYQKAVFRFVIQIVIVAAVAYFGPAGAGLLGTNLAVGTALGLTGVSAVIAGAVANAIAAMVLTNIIQIGATEIFGDKYGKIIATIATMIAFHYAGTVHNGGGGMSFDWSDMMKAENLLKLTDAVSGGMETWAQTEIEDVQGESQEAFQEYEKASDKIEDMTAEILGYSGVALDPLMSLQQGNSGASESSATFLSRTLMTGSDIADLSFRMIDSYAELSIKLPEAND